MNYDEQIDREIARDLGLTLGDLKTELRETDKLKKLDESGPFRLLLRSIVLVIQCLGAIVYRFYKVLAFPVFRPFEIAIGDQVEGKKRRWWLRFMDGIVTRVILTPVLIGVFLMLLVWWTTHPAHVIASQTPRSLGLVYRQVELPNGDGQTIRGWYIPPVKVDDVIIEGDQVIAQKWPAAVLCHGLGQSHDQYLSLASTLHDAGYAVMMLDLRGQGTSDDAAVTFGLREKLDIASGVNYLRDQPNIDDRMIAVVGYGAAGSAALQAAETDRGISVVVADSVWPTYDAWASTIFDRPAVTTKFLSAAYGVTFEMMFRERLARLDLTRVVGLLTKQSVLFIARDAPDQANTKEVLALAGCMPGPHSVDIVRSDDGAEDKICAFLNDQFKWVDLKTRNLQNIKQLYKSRVK